MTVSITLGWPAKALSPNARGHWATLAKARKAARHEGFFAALATHADMMRGSKGALVQVTFTPPSRHHRDTDNMVASIKSHLDGIADAIGIDDSKWTWAAPVIAEPCKPGHVVVTLTRIERAAA
jgi:crossover junction endodeoxyribonuclease RusA